MASTADGAALGDETEQELLLAILAGEVDVKSLGLAAEDARELNTLVQNMVDGLRPVYPEGVPDGAPQTAGKTGEVSMWTAAPSAFDLRKSETPTNTYAEDVPGVPAAKYMHNILTTDECARFLDITERMGFTEHDLVKNYHAAVTWVADVDSMIEPIFQRCLPFLPQELQVKGIKRKASGLNARLRVYRYQADGEQTFRPHTDDSFPMSSCVDDRLIWDVTNGKMASVFTFLLYLTEEFDGGHTTFFQNQEKTNETSTATVGAVTASVKPLSGSVLVFPQTCRTEPLSDADGESAGLFTADEEEFGFPIRTITDQLWMAPMHEGSPVKAKKGGRPKYVVRSDIMYSFE